MKLIQTIHIPSSKEISVEFSPEESRAAEVARAIDLREMFQRYGEANVGLVFSYSAARLMAGILEDFIERHAKSRRTPENVGVGVGGGGDA